METLAETELCIINSSEITLCR